MAVAFNFQANYGIAPGGCYPQGMPHHHHCPGPYGPPPCWNWNQGHGNLPNANVGNHGFLGLGNTKGFAIDNNNDGRYTRGQDGVLAMDLNRDGRVTPNEIEGSKERLNAMGGNFDLNGDGRTTICERSKGASYQREMQQYDTNHDGRLSGGEFANAGGRVLVDSNRDGKFQGWEQHSPFNFPTGGFGRGSLNYVDPFCGGSSVNHKGNPWGPSPWGPCY